VAVHMRNNLFGLASIEICSQFFFSLIEELTIDRVVKKTKEAEDILLDNQARI
jgi:hypothetical protein